MRTGARIILKLDVNVDEILDIQKAWKSSGVGSLEQYALLLLRGKVAEFQENERRVTKGNGV